MKKKLYVNALILFIVPGIISCRRNLVDKGSTACTSAPIQASKVLSLTSTQITKNIESPWQGGLINFKHLSPSLLKNPFTDLTETQSTCSGIFEFFKDNDTYKIRTYTQYQCQEYFRLWAAKGSISLFETENEQRSAGYTTIPIINPEFEQRMAILKGINFPEEPGLEKDPNSVAKITSQDTRSEFVRGSLSVNVPALPFYFYQYFQATKIEAPEAFYKTMCIPQPMAAINPNKPENKNEISQVPIPNLCVWPQDFLITNLQIDKEFATKNKILLDNLIIKSQELKKIRKNTRTLSAQDITRLETFTDNWSELLKTTEILRNFQTINNNFYLIATNCDENYVTEQCANKGNTANKNICKELYEQNCAFYKQVTKKVLLPFYNKEIQDTANQILLDDQVTQEEYNGFNALTEEKKATRNIYLGKIYEHLKDLPIFLKNNKDKISVFANHLTTEVPQVGKFAFKGVPLFGDLLGKKEKELQGITPEIKDSALYITYGDKVTNLKQPLQNGSIITIDNFPIFALTTSSIQSDGVALMPAPAPQKRDSGDALSNNCMPK